MGHLDQVCACVHYHLRPSIYLGLVARQLHFGPCTMSSLQDVSGHHLCGLLHNKTHIMQQWFKAVGTTICDWQHVTWRCLACLERTFATHGDTRSLFPRSNVNAKHSPIHHNILDFKLARTPYRWWDLNTCCQTILFDDPSIESHLQSSTHVILSKQWVLWGDTQSWLEKCQNTRYVAEEKVTRG